MSGDAVSRPLRPIGFGNGCGYFSVDGREIWGTVDEFARVTSMSPYLYNRYRYAKLIKAAGEHVVVPAGLLPNPFPSRPTFLGHLMTGPDCLGYAVFINLGYSGVLAEMTLGSPAVASREFPFSYYCYAPEGWSVAETLGRHSPDLVATVRRMDKTLLLPPATAVFPRLETFIGSFDGVDHYYGGPSHGWVSFNDFVAGLGTAPRDYVFEHYRCVVDSGDCAALVGKHLLPDPEPHRPTYLGLMLLGDGRALAVFVNAALPRSTDTQDFFDSVHNATRGSPNYLATRRLPAVYGAPLGWPSLPNTIQYVAKGVVF